MYQTIFRIIEHIRQLQEEDDPLPPVALALLLVYSVLILFGPFAVLYFNKDIYPTRYDFKKTFPEHKKQQEKPAKETNTSNTLLFKKWFKGENDKKQQEKPAKETNTSNTVLFKKWFKEENDFLKFRVEMPGLSWKDVKLTVEKNILLIKGDNVEECATKYIRQFEIPTQHYDIYSIMAQMENGVLKVVVPKVKQVKNDSFEVLVLGPS